MSIRFAAVGMAHPHIYNIVNALLGAGAELVWYYDDASSQQAAEFSAKYPQAQLARSVEEILEDETIPLVVSADVPNKRGPLGVRVMQHGKDYCSAKPGFVTFEQLEEARRVQAETGRIHSVFFGERFANPATIKAGELVHSGAIGDVVQTTGFGPHRLFGYMQKRPDWQFDRNLTGGIINDLASHQIDQFLYFTSSTTAQVVTSQVARVRFTEYPNFEDFADLLLRSDHATGYIRVDWLTPDGLDTWGDVRLFIVGTQGYIEVRKQTDVARQSGGNHLYMADHSGMQYIDCNDMPMPFGEQLIYDVLNRTETAMTQAHCFLTCELALRAQTQATMAFERT